MNPNSSKNYITVNNGLFSQTKEVEIISKNPLSGSYTVQDSEGKTYYTKEVKKG